MPGQDAIRRPSVVLNMFRNEKGDGANLPERPGGCFAQISPVPFFVADFVNMTLVNVPCASCHTKLAMRLALDYGVQQAGLSSHFRVDIWISLTALPNGPHVWTIAALPGR
jgi:hypothetical protein